MTFLQLQETILSIQAQEKIPASVLINLELVFIDDDDRDNSVDIANLLVDDEDKPLRIHLRRAFSVNDCQHKEKL